MPRLDLLQLRRGISSLWSSRNPTLADGELAWDKTANLLKIGDGTTNWNSLGYVGGLADGDKGDITVSASGATWTIDALAVTNAKINDVAWSKVTSTPTTLSGYGITDAITSAAVAAGYQPLDSDLTAIAALATTSFGRGLLTETNASSIRSTLGLGTSNSPSFSRVALNTGTLTTSFPAWDVTQTWNDAAVTFTALKADVTDTASNASSLLMDLQVGGSSRFGVRKDGIAVCDQMEMPFAGASRHAAYSRYGIYLGLNTSISFYTTINPVGAVNGTNVVLDSAGTLAQRNGTNAQTFRLYNTFTDASNYERGKLEWSSNVFRIGTEKAGTGSARALELQTDGTTRLTIETTGTVNIPGDIGTLGNAVSNVKSTQFELLGNRLNPASGWDQRKIVLGPLQGGSTPSDFVLGLAADTTIAFWPGNSTSGSPDLRVTRDAVGTLAQRNAGNAQTFRIYNTFTDASNYERGKLEWSSNVFRIGTEKAGTGSARALELQTDGTTRLTIGSTGIATFSSRIDCTAVWVNASENLAEFTHLTRLSLRVGGGGYSVVRLGGVYQSDNTLITIGGTASSFPAIKRNAAALNFRLADDSADCDITAAALTLSGNLTISTKNLVTDTTTGTKIGTATTQKLGFYNATPVVQPTAVADATDAASVITQLNALLSRMRDLGLIAT